jgi:integrase
MCRRPERDSCTLSGRSIREGSAVAATVTKLKNRRRTPSAGATGGPTVRVSIDAFLDSPKIKGNANTLRAYTNVLDRIGEQLGPGQPLAGVDDGEIGEALTTLWGEAAPSTWNRNRAAVGSWLAWCADKQHWAGPAVTAATERWRENNDDTKAVPRSRIDRLCRRRDVPLREKTLWRMLYESASRVSAVLALNIEDLDLPNRQARIVTKGGDIIWITWGTDTARLLPRLIAGRTSGRCSCRSTGSARTVAPPLIPRTSARKPAEPAGLRPRPHPARPLRRRAPTTPAPAQLGYAPRREQHLRQRHHGQDRA